MLNTRDSMREGTNECTNKWMYTTTKHITTLLLHSRVKKLSSVNFYPGLEISLRWPILKYLKNMKLKYWTTQHPIVWRYRGCLSTYIIWKGCRGVQNRYFFLSILSIREYFLSIKINNFSAQKSKQGAVYSAMGQWAWVPIGIRPARKKKEGCSICQ